MSLLPNAMRLPDLPMTLGAKVEKPAPKKHDPIAAFEGGEHLPDGTVVMVDSGAAEDSAWAVFERAFDRQFVLSFAEPPVSPRQAAVAAKMADIQRAKQELRNLQSKTGWPKTIEALFPLTPVNPSATAAQLKLAVDRADVQMRKVFSL